MQGLPPTIDSPENPYRPPPVTPDMITKQRFDQICKDIEAFGDETPVPESSPASKTLDKDLLEALWAFTETPDLELLTLGLQWLGDAARVVKNRHFIGGLFTPMPPLLALLEKHMKDEETKRMIIRLIANLCFDNPYLREKYLAEPDAIAKIVKCLDSDDEETQRITCGCVANLCSVTESICLAMHEGGATVKLLNLIKSENDNVQCMACRGLRNIAEHETIRMFIAQNGLLEVGVGILRDTEDDDGLVAEFFGIIGSLISTKTIMMDFIFKYHGIKILLNALVKAKNVNLIVDLTDLLQQWAEDEHLQVLFLKGGFLPYIKQHYMDKSHKNEVRVALGKIYCSLSTNEQILPLLYKELDDFIHLVEDPEKEIQVVAMMTIANLGRSDSYCLDMVEKNLPDFLLTVLNNPERDMRVRHYSCAALRNLSINEKNKPVLLKMGILKPVCALLDDTTNHVVVYSAIGVIKSLLGGGATYADALLEQDGITRIVKLIDFKDSDHVKFESCRVLGILMRLSPDFQALVLKQNGQISIPTMLESKHDILKKEGLQSIKALIDNGKIEEVKALNLGEAVAAIPNLTEASEAHDDTKQLATDLLQFFKN